MALISMAVYATEENKRTPLLERTMESLIRTVDFSRHRVVVVNNASCKEAVDLLKVYENQGLIKVIHNETNLGTAGAVNLAWRLREPGECVVKMDDDVVIHQAGWADQMEYVIKECPEVGIVALKRDDLEENPYYEEGHPYKSRLQMLGIEKDKHWRAIEIVNHCIGTCQMYNPSLLEKIGYLYQPRLYGFDDSLAAIRCIVAGFVNAFLIGIDISHIDHGGTAYQEWKTKVSGEDMGEYNRLKWGYFSGQIPIMYDPFKFVAE